MDVSLSSTRALRAFEATVRLGSLKAASEYLCVTPSALSKRILALEEELGYPLFERQARGLKLTDRGVRYARQLQLTLNSGSDATHAELSL